MIQDANSPPAQLCPVCGAPLQADSRCDFDRPEEASPAHGDYDAMHKGLMTHAEHMLVVARWIMHNPQTQGPAVFERFSAVARDAWGKPQPLFPLEA